MVWSPTWGMLPTPPGWASTCRALALAADYDALAAAGAAVGADPWAWVLGGGEDHALVACFADAVPDGWRIIGRVLDGPAGVLVDGEPWRGYAGWESFAS